MAFESCCRAFVAFEAFKGCSKRATYNSFEAQQKQLVGPGESGSHIAVSKPNIETACGASGGPMAKQAGRLQAAAEGFAVQSPSKAAAGLLRLLRLFKGCSKRAA